MKYANLGFEGLKIKAKKDIKKLALPAKEEQLILLPDAAVASPGIGFILLVSRMREGEKVFLPVMVF